MSHCWITSLRFFLGLKSAHTERFFVVSNSEKRSERFYIGEKVSAHEPIFTPIKIGPCALGITHCVPCREVVCTIFMMVFDMTRPGRQVSPTWFKKLIITKIVVEHVKVYQTICHGILLEMFTLFPRPDV